MLENQKPPKFKVNPTEYERLKELVRPSVLTYLDDVTKHFKAEKSFRPTVNLIIETNQKFLQYRLNDQENTSLFGGGIDNDDILTAILRELYEETSITADQVEQMKYLYYDCAETSSDRKNRDGYEKGKLYFYFHLKLPDDLDLSTIVLECQNVTLISSETPIGKITETKRAHLTQALKAL